jgi:ABC-type glycerol-3-phosphate transport system substrate-binding protein
MGSNIPSRTAKEAADAFLNSTPPMNNQAFLDGIAYAGPEAALWAGDFGDVDNNVIEPELSKIWQGKQTVEEFSKTICQKVDAKLSPAAAATEAK